MGSTFPDSERQIQHFRLLHRRSMASATLPADKCGHNFWHHAMWKFGVTQIGIGYIHYHPSLSESHHCYILIQGGREGVSFTRSIFSNSTVYKDNKEQDPQWYIICYLSGIYHHPCPPSPLFYLPHKTYPLIDIILITISLPLYLSYPPFPGSSSQQQHLPPLVCS